MDIYPLGHASFKFKGKQGTVVTDPFDSSMMGIKFPKVEDADVVTVSHDHPDHNFVSAVSGSPFVISGPGEYEVKGITIYGFSSYHDDKEGAERGKNTIYKITMDGLRICHLGDLGHKLSQEMVDKIGDVDILFVPIGGFFTIDSETAAAVVSQIEPFVVIPMHYKKAGLKDTFDKLEGKEGFLKKLGAEETEPINKYSISKDKLPENTTVVILE